jgi:predicted dienelactone hydrolase
MAGLCHLDKGTPMPPIIRAFYRSAAITGATPPHDRISLKVFYPAAPENTAMERNTGVIPADPSGSPFPVVILFPGINLGPEAYAWLAIELAGRSYAVVTFSAITEEMPGFVSLSPGLILDELTPQRYGNAPACSTLQPIMDELAELNRTSLLAGLLDLETVILGGHSAGGTIALLSADPDLFPGIRGVFCYGAHSGASVELGWPPETVMPLPGKVPTLMLGGDRDGVIAGSAHRYGRDEEDPVHTVRKTFEEGLTDPLANSYLFIIKGANHFSFSHNDDGTTGRAFLDWEPGADQTVIRQRIGKLIVDFLEGEVRGDSEAHHRLQAALGDGSMSLACHKTQD